MKRTLTSYQAMQMSENVAQPHLRIDNKVHTISPSNSDYDAPAGGVWSSASDMAQFIRLHMNEGVIGGKRILKETTVKEMRKPLVLDHWPDPVLPPSHLNAYGSGWILNTYHGRLVVWHNGLVRGMLSMVGYLPEEDLGIVIMSNHQRNLFNVALFYHIINQHLGIPDSNLDAANRELLAEHVAKMVANLKRKELSRRNGTTPTLPLKSYLGTYEREYELKATITQNDDGSLVLQHGSFTADMEHWQDDEFRATLRQPRLKAEETWFVKFNVIDDAPVSMYVSSEHDITASFRRLPEEQVDRDTLATASGNPRLPPGLAIVR